MSDTFTAVPGLRRVARLLCAGCGLLLLGAAAATVWLPGWAGTVVALALWVAGIAATLPSAGGCIAVARQARLESGRPDLFLERNAVRSEEQLAQRRLPAWRALRRRLAAIAFGHRHLVGDAVRIRALHDIRATLDAQGCLDGLPFMEEMAAFCGREAVVYRVVDKIYDYGRSRRMRRLDDCVLLMGQRCDGAAHAGCEAACYLIWKSQWLEPLSEASPQVMTQDAPLAPPASGASDPATVYSCQYTQLTAASNAMSQGDWRGLLGPWVVGNVTATAFWVAVATRAFNALQLRRGGLCYPAQPPGGNDKTTQVLALRPGQWVRVRSSTQIARTLDKNSKNRGLWFDRDMLKHCGSMRRVRGRVQKIIDIHSGRMIPMKTACITLEDVHYSGEFQGFGEQHDYLYWREAWLEPVDPGSGGNAATPTP
ncbi:MAG TPA: hypothetical protein VI032_11690 [Burkholderiaceae bacterium]